MNKDMTTGTSEAQRAAEVRFKPEQFYLTGQKRMIVDYIAEHGSITPMEAWDECRCTKLATRIGEIERRSGYVFDRKMERTEDVCFMRYSFASGLSAISYLLPTDEKVADMLREMTKS